MKKFIASIIIVMIIFPFTSVGVYAYEGGLLEGKPLMLCETDQVCHDTTLLATDGNLATYVTLGPGSSGADGIIDWLLYDFKKAVTITDYQVYATQSNPNENAYFRFWFEDINGNEIHPPSGPTYWQTPINTDGNKYSIGPIENVRRIGIQGNPNTADIRIYEIDVFGTIVTPPEAPEGVTATIEENEVVISWNEVNDIDVKGYYVYRNNVKISGLLTTTTFTDSNVLPNVNYSYQVTSIDISGNESARSAPAIVRIEEKIPLSVSFIPAGNAILVNVNGGKPPYTVSMVNPPYHETINGKSHTIRNLELSTDYTITVMDSDGETITETINTGDKVGFIPPDFPDSTTIFQKILNSFGSAGQVGIAIILAAVALAVIIILGLYGWRLTKRWLASIK